MNSCPFSTKFLVCSVLYVVPLVESLHKIMGTYSFFLKERINLQRYYPLCYHSRGGLYSIYIINIEIFSNKFQ